MRSSRPAALVATLLVASGALQGPTEIKTGPVHSMIEIPFTGPRLTVADSPARDVQFWARVRHESGAPTYQLHGFWDGGETFKIRFTATRPGRWTLVEVHSTRRELHGQHQGRHVVASSSTLPGFWEVDDESPGGRWYRRSDGSRQYIVGNTLYSFLSETYLDGKPNGSDIASDVRGSAEYFRKIRFSPIGDLYPHSTAAPFLNDRGRPTYDGDYSHRPNPEWFRTRADLAVRTAFERDVIADLIMAGVDTREARSALQPAHNGGDAEPFLRYLAARYGAYPNVWLTLINEYDIRTPRYSPDEIIALGRTLQTYLPYPTPVSVHRDRGPWEPRLNTEPPWNDRVIIQQKLRDLTSSADAIIAAHRAGAGDKPVVNDELSYQGAGDDHSHEDTIESHLGAFLGGGYGTTGYKSGNKLGQYFAGSFDATEHTAAANLRWLRERIDEHVTFWRMEPVAIDRSIFSGAHASFRAMHWPGLEYVLGTNGRQDEVVADLPPGRWDVRRFDVLARDARVLAKDVQGQFAFDTPDSRAALFHFRRTAAD